LDWVLHEIPAESGYRNIAMILHVFVLFAKELNVGLRVFTAKGEGDKEVVIVFVPGFEKQFEKADEARQGRLQIQPGLRMRRR
jgi:hypothetical protein